MNILISNEQETVGLDERFLRTLKSVAGFVLENEQVEENTELSIALVEKNEIQSLNAKYRGKDVPTDVLSFEFDSETDGNTDNRKAQPAGFPKMLGDVIICPSVAVRQAAEYGQTFEQEMKLLLIHGILHLIGYDHIEGSEAGIMENREREILGRLSQVYPVDLQPLDMSLNEGLGGNG